ncbi:MAG: transcriptional regulator [Sphingomonas bacterium]|jgi:CheY-like chemotaxis protein|nr:transcriptional regulator [Sphingomonas bacterium]MDB5682597.1 transcriptional regulator [Sphingomonas bacterium]MDB5719138.1 transcriptional regulator [Sphingomonas bacterium]
MAASLSVLIVEDEPLIAMMLEDFVDALGHTVAGTADTVAGALEKVSEGGFDVVILDVHLRGGEPSWPVADALSDRRVPFLLATGGHVAPPPVRHAAAAVLPKPFTMDSIKTALEASVAAV